MPRPRDPFGEALLAFHQIPDKRNAKLELLHSLLWEISEKKVMTDKMATYILRPWLKIHTRKKSPSARLLRASDRVHKPWVDQI
jgi:hypothetical protein